MPLLYKDLLTAAAAEGRTFMAGQRVACSLAPESTLAVAVEEALALKRASIAGFPQSMFHLRRDA